MIRPFVARAQEIVANSLNRLSMTSFRVLRETCALMHADGDVWSSRFSRKLTHIDPMTSKSQSGWVVCFAGAPITWVFKMQTITDLSTTEVEYITLSTSLREVIPLMGKPAKMAYKSRTFPSKIIAPFSNTTVEH